jgi:predicted F0F1-ATPase subunit
MPELPHSYRREDARERTRKDLERLTRRGAGTTFWRSLALLGSVGWPIVGLGTGGALCGRYLDAHLHTGHALTLTLLLLGIAAGSVAAYRSLRGTHP